MPSTVSRAFYFWKSVYNPTPFEALVLDSLHCHCLYIKFFDVDLIDGRPLPVAPIVFKKQPTASSIVPTIFITQACIKWLTVGSAPELANHIATLTETISNTAALQGITEVQIDCDWTATTAPQYFALLKALRQAPFLKNKTLSATIRLYQIKYSSKTGIPPVDRGLLMGYNMGDLKSSTAENSILDASVIEQYRKAIHTYPLLLDAALPLFEWGVLYRHSQYAGLIHDVDTASLRSVAQSVQKNSYFIGRDTVLFDIALRSGDLVRYESIPNELLDKTASLLYRELPSQSRRIAFFHLDSASISRHSLSTLEDLYRRFE